MNRLWTLMLLAPLGLIVGPARADDSLGGASTPKPQMSLKNPNGQYKRIHQFALRMMLLDRETEAEMFLQQHLAKHPEDAESHFMLGVLYARANRAADSAHMMRQAVEFGLPPGRVLAGPRKLLASLQEQPFLRELARQQRATPIHGPLVGNVTDHSASFWVRTVESQAVTVLVSQSPDLAEPVFSSTQDSSPQRDFTAVVSVDGLKPDKQYHYAVSLGDAKPTSCPVEQRFRTFPSRGTPGAFTIAFGGGAGYVPPNERVWTTIGSFDPLALLLLGDNVYIDDPESVNMQMYTYYRRQSRPEYRRLTASTAVFSIWDDHDFGTNDCWGGPLVDKPIWKKTDVWRIYQENWPNPAFGGGSSQPGCWYSFAMGDIDFFMLDCRYYRTSPRAESTSMLGPAQLAWLKSELQAARGTFKVLCSSVPWDFRTKGDSRDTWNGFQHERDEIFGFLAEHDVEGVLLMSADRHRSDAWCIERPDSYDLYEFNSSRLTNQHVHPSMEKKGAIFSYNKQQSFGLVRFDTTVTDPRVTYSVVNIDGQKQHELEVRLSQLRARP